jgi:hypothetical protein
VTFRSTIDASPFHYRPSRHTAQIQSNDRLNYNNSISYKQAYYTIQTVLLEMYIDKAMSFAKFPTYRERFVAADLENYCKLVTNQETNSFMDISFALAGLQHAYESMIEMIGVTA